MSSADYLKKWSWNCICDRCGKKAKAEELKLEWDGLRVCQRCYEIRQPQDFVRGQVDRQAPPWTRPEAPDTFVTPQCSYLGVSAIPGYAQPGCARPSYVSPEISIIITLN